VIGQDIGIFGGAYRVTEGLYEEFGPERALDTATSEIAIAGTAVGAAMTGMLPIAEFQFNDFFFCAMDQICNQVAMTGREQIRCYAAKAGVKIDGDAVDRRNRELKEKYAHLVEPIPGNIELLNLLRGSGHPVAIASGSSLQSIEPIMRRFGIVVDAVVCADDVARGKPHPDLFLAAARKLGVAPENCTVLEDAEVGVQAARAAGMKVFYFINAELPPR
jgi:HAD superfamily hydrolase (TIGR01509 family)